MIKTARLNTGAPALFFEQFDPRAVSLFDTELDELVKTYALEKGVIEGFCNISAQPTEFNITDANFRENVVSTHSFSTNRQRALVCGLSVALLGHGLANLPEITAHINRHNLKVYTAEANSPIFLALRDQIRPDLFVYSEYFGDHHHSGEFVNGLLHQDLQATSFADATFDLILTSDVLEHVSDAIQAEREIFRILKPGGSYCFTVPFAPLSEHDFVLAEKDAQGQVIYFAEPQYHGDPLRSEGILVYRIFSYNDLNSRFTALGGKLNHYRFWSKTLGILDNNIIVHHLEKPGSAGPASQEQAAPVSRKAAARRLSAKFSLALEKAKHIASRW